MPALFRMFLFPSCSIRFSFWSTWFPRKHLLPGNWFVFCFAVQDVHFFCAYSLILEAALSFMKRKSYKIRPRVRTFEASCAGVFLPIRRQQNSPSGYSIGRAEMLFYFAAVLMNKRCSAVTSLKRAKISFIILKHTRVRLIWSEGSF